MWPIIVGTLKIPLKKFFVTPKHKAKGNNSYIALATPHFILIILSILSIVNCIDNIFVHHHEGSIVVLFWLLYNTYLLLKSILYYVGRVNYRSHERIAAQIPVVLLHDNRKMHGTIYDLSEGGMAVLLNTPEYLSYDSDFTVEASYGEYKARLNARVRQVQEEQNNWKYSLVVSPVSEEDKQQYLQILFDRNHLLPRVITLSFLTDLMMIIRGILSKPRRGERRLPRMAMHAKLHSPEVGDVEVVNFNYKYISLKKQQSLPDALTLQFGDEIRIHCSKDSEFNNSRLSPTLLYQIENWQSHAVDSRFRDILLRYCDSRADDAGGPLLAATPVTVELSR